MTAQKISFSKTKKFAALKIIALSLLIIFAMKTGVPEILADWTPTDSGQRGWQPITSSSDGTKLAAAVAGGFIYTSTDSGATWTAQSGSGSRSWPSITSSSDGTKLAAGDAGGFIYTSTDSGATWTQQSGPGSRSWYSITSSSNGTKLTASAWNGFIYTFAPDTTPPTINNLLTSLKDLISKGSDKETIQTFVDKLKVEFDALFKLIDSTSTTPNTFTKDLELNSVDEEVRTLQKFLNTKGYTVSTSGPGSIGNETNTFGPATKSALIKFQIANNITPSVGYFGSVTRGVVGGWK